MMYAFYRNEGFDASNRRVLLFVTASQQMAEDAVALATLEKEEHFNIWMRYQRDDISSEVCAELQRLALTVDPDGRENGISYEYEGVEVR